MAKNFSEMTKEEQYAALTETFNLMNGEPWCEKHNCEAPVSLNDGMTHICPQCAAEHDEEDRKRIAKMNADIAFADWHSRTDS